MILTFPVISNPLSDIDHHLLQIPKTAHYYTLGQLSASTKYIWLVCHGYGQAADRFLKKFDHLDLDQHFFIAPEGLSRFYWQGVHGDVVASWMTSKDRLHEIDDHTNFLNSIYEHYASQYPTINWVFFGFSQGCATIMRYLDKYRVKGVSICLWAGSLPPDLNYADMSPYLNQMDLTMIVGDNDEYIPENRLQQELVRLQQHQVPLNIIRFSGTHRIDRNVLSQYIATW